MSNSNIVTLLAEARSALYAIAKTYDDHELRARALEVYESTTPETIHEDAGRVASLGWYRLTDSLPDPDRYPRVLIYTEGVDFNGEQFFDVKADSLNENSYESPDDQPEICRAATHWMPRPFVDPNAQMAAQAGQWVHCSPALLKAGVSCAHTPRRPCQCRPENGGHDHFIAFNVTEASRATAQTELMRDRSMDKYRFFYRIDGLDLVPGNKTAGFCFSVLTQALADLIQIQVPSIEIERLMSDVHQRIARVGGSVYEAGQQAQILFVEGTACPRAFIADPLFGGSLGADPETFGRLHRPDRLDWIGPEVEYTPHNCDTPDQAIILVVLVQAWAEYARAKLRDRSRQLE